jgi:hypothetical protein
MTKVIRVMVAEKQVEEKIEGEYITRRIHRLPLASDVVELVDWWVTHLDFGDDWEVDIGGGMYCDQDGDLRWVLE